MALRTGPAQGVNSTPSPSPRTKALDVPVSVPAEPGEGPFEQFAQGGEDEPEGHHPEDPETDVAQEVLG